MRSAIRWSRAVRPAIFAFVLLLLAGPLAAPAGGDGQIVENPAKPTAKNAGRIVTLTEVLAISDEGTTDYYFKWPHTLKTGPDGSLVLIDWDQVLRFDKNGKFQGNFLKNGQGPGEVNSPGACASGGRPKELYLPGPMRARRRIPLDGRMVRGRDVLDQEIPYRDLTGRCQ